MWCGDNAQLDSRALFQGRLTSPQYTPARFCVAASGPYQAWVDGEPVQYGPARYPADRPEFTETTVNLDAGDHSVVVVAHHEGRTERMETEHAFVWVALRVDGGVLPVSWRCRPLRGYRSRVGRINPNLGWMEWCDTREDSWPEAAGEGAEWSSVSEVALQQTPVQADYVPAVTESVPFQPVADGTFAERFAIASDYPAVWAMMRDLAPAELPADGIWGRFRLDRIRLGRPWALVSGPPGATVELLYAEHAETGRVEPVIAWSNGPSNPLDHYVLRGGVQRIGPLGARGLGWMEVHVTAASGPAKILDAGIDVAEYYGPPVGAIESGDVTIDAVWSTGVATLRSCTEDAVTDCPTRERGQWLGDLAVAAEVAAVAYGDLGPIRRGLVQLARCADARGLVAAQGPGLRYYHATYAMDWAVDCVRMVELDHDMALLRELDDAARRNGEALWAGWRDGVDPDWPSPYIEWGLDSGSPDGRACAALLYVRHLRAMERWWAVVGDSAGAARETERLSRVLDFVKPRLPADGRDASPGWGGFHSTALALVNGLLDEASATAGVEDMKQHIRSSFPNRADASRVFGFVVEPPFITPYFLHHALVPLWERGETDFILDQFRTCWGWMLDRGATTWYEVFDTRWSRCHQWSSAPTWQLSRYLLGLWPRGDLGTDRFDLRLRPGSLPRARGILPDRGSPGPIAISWTQGGGCIEYLLTPARDLVISMENGSIVNVLAGRETRLQLPVAQSGTRGPA